MTDKTQKMFSKKCKYIYDNITFIDPGLGGTGLAFFTKVKGKLLVKKDSDISAPCKTKSVTGSKRDTWQHQCLHIAKQCRGFFAATETQHVVIEHPELWMSSPVSIAAAFSGKKGEPGKLFKLMYLIGVIASAASSVTDTVPVLINPSGWKGQLPKDVIDKRIKKAIGLEYPDHVSDAVGIGLAIQGKI